MDSMSEPDGPSCYYRNPPTEDNRSFFSSFAKRICCCFTTTEDDLYIPTEILVDNSNTNTDNENDNDHDETKEEREESVITFASHVQVESPEIQTLVANNLEPIMQEDAHVSVSLPIESVAQPVNTSTVTPSITERKSVINEISISNVKVQRKSVEDVADKGVTVEEVTRKESLDSVASTMTNAERSIFYSNTFLQQFVDQIISDGVQFSSTNYKEQECQSSSSNHLKITSVKSGSEMVTSTKDSKKRHYKKKDSKERHQNKSRDSKRDRRSKSVLTFKDKYRMPDTFDIEDHVRYNKNPYPGLASQLRENKNKRIIDVYGHPVNFIQQGDKDFADVVVPVKSNLISKLFDLYTFEDVANVKVVIGDRDYFCHLLILQTYSQYFELNVGLKTYNLPPAQVSAYAFGQIYNWMRAGPEGIRNITRNDIIDIFAAAQFLKIRILEAQILTILINASEFSEERAFYVYMKAKQFHMSEIQTIMMRRIRSFFLKLVGTRNFVELELHDVLKLLSSDLIEANCEMEIFLAGVRWLRYDWKRRMCNLVWVMACVRFELIDYMQLMKLKRHSKNDEIDFILKNPSVRIMVEKGMAYYVYKYLDDDTNPRASKMLRKVDYAKSRKRLFTGLNQVYRSYKDFLYFLSECSNTTESIPESSMGSEETDQDGTYDYDVNELPPVELVGQSWYNIDQQLIDNKSLISGSSIFTIFETQSNESSYSGNLNKPDSMDILNALTNFPFPPVIEENEELLEEDENNNLKSFEQGEFDETVLDVDAVESIDKGNESVAEHRFDLKGRIKIPKYLFKSKECLVEKDFEEPEKPVNLSEYILKSKKRFVEQELEEGVKEDRSSNLQYPNDDYTITKSTSPTTNPTTDSLVKNDQTKQEESKPNQSDVVNIYLYSHDDMNNNESVKTETVNTEQNQTVSVHGNLQIDPNKKQRSEEIPNLNLGEDLILFSSDEKIESKRTPKIESNSDEDSMSRNALGNNDKNLSTTDLKYDVLIPIPVYSLNEPVSDSIIRALNDPGIGLFVNRTNDNSTFQKDGDPLVLQAEIKKPNRVSGLQAIFEKGHKALQLKRSTTHSQRTYEEATTKLHTTVETILNIAPTRLINADESDIQDTTTATDTLKPILKHESAYNTSDSEIKCKESLEESTNESDIEYKQSVKIQPSRGKIPRRRYMKASKKCKSIQISESKRPIEAREVLTSTTDSNGSDSESENTTKSNLASNLIKPILKRSVFNITEPKPNDIDTDSIPQEAINVEQGEEHVALKPDEKSRANSAESVNRRNGTYYKKLMLTQCDEVNQIADKLNKMLKNEELALSESMTGLIRAATGNAHILTTKKLKQFEKLCNQNLGVIPTDIGYVHDIDLEAWWEVVLTEIHELEEKFENIESLLVETREKD